MTNLAQNLLYRFAPSIVAAMLYGVFAAIWLRARPLYVPLVGLFDSTPDRPPFGDLGAILQAGLCWRQGVNVYLPSTCMGGGVFNYAPLMLRSVLLPFNPGETTPLGLLVAALFLLACACLPPAQTPGQLLPRCLALSSGMVMYALEAANFDAVIFVMLVAGLLLLRLRSAWSLGAYAVFAAGAGWKFYPAILLSLGLRERGWRLGVLAAVLAAGGGLFMLRFGAQSLFALNTLPAGLPYRGGFSAMNLPFGVALLACLPHITLNPDKPAFFSAVGTPHFAIFVVSATHILTGAALLAGWALSRPIAPALARLDPGRRLFLLAGALLIAFCFYVAPNYDYRGIFLLFTLPALQRLGAGPARLWRFWAAAVLLLLWEAPLRAAIGGTGLLALRIAFWFARDSLWWAVVLGFTAIAFAELRATLQWPPRDAR